MSLLADSKHSLMDPYLHHPLVSRSKEKPTAKSLKSILFKSLPKTHSLIHPQYFPPSEESPVADRSFMVKISPSPSPAHALPLSFPGVNLLKSPHTSLKKSPQFSVITFRLAVAMTKRIRCKTSLTVLIGALPVTSFLIRAPAR